MVRLLVTGFEPFGGSHVNPSELLVRRLEQAGLAGVELRVRVLPCRFTEAGRSICAEVDAWAPEAVVAFGQGGGASLAVERVGVNLEDARIPDNIGDQPADRPIAPGGPAAYFATLPVRSIVADLNADGVPARLSLSAGTFVCNHVLYTLLHHLDRRGLTIPAGFIHVPKLPEQVATSDTREKEPSLGIETIERGARRALEVVAAHVRAATATAAAR